MSKNQIDKKIHVSQNHAGAARRKRLLLFLAASLILMLIVSSCKPAFGRNGADDTDPMQETQDSQTTTQDNNETENESQPTSDVDTDDETETSDTSSDETNTDSTSDVEPSETETEPEPTIDDGLMQEPPSEASPVIVLTFDDGPGMDGDQPLTETVLDILAEEQVKATFFVLGTQIAAGREHILRRTFAEGHEIGNHSYSHAILTDVDDTKIRQELEDTNALIEQVTGQLPTVMRPPTGAQNEQVRAISEALGLAVVNWSWQSTPEDWNHHDNPDYISEHVIEHAGNGHIVLLHDINQGTIAALPDMIAGLKEKGFRFMTVSELLSHLGDEHPKPGAFYTHYALPES